MQPLLQAALGQYTELSETFPCAYVTSQIAVAHYNLQSERANDQLSCQHCIPGLQSATRAMRTACPTRDHFVLRCSAASRQTKTTCHPS